MREVSCYKIENEMNGGSWTFVDISEAEAQELYLAFLEDAIEEDVMETQQIEYCGLSGPKPDWWRVDYQEEVDRLLLMDGEFYMYKFKAYAF